MREFRFRAWNKELKVMVFLRNDMEVVDFWKDGEWGLGGHDDAVDQDSGFIMQWTGIQDKNGVDIYEGDIIKIKEDMDRSEWEEIVPIVYCTHCASFEGREKNGSGITLEHKEIEIIGNIFENPELLGEKQ